MNGDFSASSMAVLILHGPLQNLLHFSAACGCKLRERLALRVGWLSFTSPAEGEMLFSSSPNQRNLNHDDIFFSLYQKAKKFFVKE